ncbi:hypothetical protein [Ruminococcus albus]|uniref:hypothetical protein n=1 Tax=Ruminococcus albus TaxID=1264 RepID=UPI0004B64616|nr:hypothetical protein [Ruminococcus albus]
MVLYSKCSFRSGNGYQMGMCSMDSDCAATLHPLSNQPLPQPIDFLFNTDFSNTVILASSDDKNCLFLAVMGIVDADNEKYINVVISDPQNPDNIINLFSQFTNHYGKSLVTLTDCFERTQYDDSLLGTLDYSINANNLRILRSFSCPDKNVQSKYYIPLNTIFAFITEHKYSDYQQRISLFFSIRDKNKCVFNQINPSRDAVDCCAIYDLLRTKPQSHLMKSGLNTERKKTGINITLERGAEDFFSRIDPFRKK